MAVVTVQAMLDRIRQRTDQVSSGFVTDAEIINLINVGKRKHDSLLTQAFGNDYSATSATFSATANTEAYSLSAITSGSFYKLLGLDRASTASPTGWLDVKPFNFHDRNNPSSFPGLTIDTANGEIRYRLYGDKLIFRPVPTGTITIKAWWLKQEAAFTATSDSFDDLNGSSEFIVLDASIAIKDKGEEDTSVLQNDRNIETKRIMDMAPSRDAGELGTVAYVMDRPLPYVITPWR